MKNVVLNFVRNNREKGLVLADQGLVSGVNFLVGIILARFLSVELFGLFSLAWMVIYFASGLQQSFLTAPLFALTVKQKDTSSWFGRLASTQLALSVLSFAFVFIALEIAYYFQPSWRFSGVTLTLSLLTAVYLFNDFSRRIMFVQNDPEKALKIDILGYALQPVFIGSLYLFDLLELWTALAAVLAAQVLSTLYILLVIRPNFQYVGIGETALKLWVYSKYLLATALLQWSSANYIILYAASILGPAAIGAIRVSQNLMGVLNVLFQAMENIIPARSAEALQRGGNQALQIYIKKITLQLLIPVILFLGSIALFNEEIIKLIYGEEYVPYSFVLVSFCGIYLFVFLGTLLRFVIRTLEHNQLIFISYVLTTVFSLLVGKILASSFGLEGVMIGIAGTQLISFLSFIIYLKFKVKWNFRLFTLS
ncbi:MAG: lipopolysaccharide biosynthesis protein [Flavobacteriales bacterium]